MFKKENGKRYIDYESAIKWLGNKYILCDEICEIDMSIYNNYDGDIRDITQYYLSDCSSADAKFLEDSFSDIIFGYSEVLGLHVLLVFSYGVSWKQIPVEVINNNILDETLIRKCVEV